MSGIRRFAAVLVSSLALLTVVPATPSEAAEGFTKVRSSTVERTSITAVAPGEVWVAGKAANGRVRLEHRTGGTWWTAQLPVQANPSMTIHGSAKNDVWLVSSGELWRYNGAWRKVALPDERKATAVFDVVGKNVYVGTYRAATGDYGPDRIAELLRYDGRTWTNLGGPELPDEWRNSGSKEIRRIMVTNGTVRAETLYQPPSPMTRHEVYQISGTTWTVVAITGGSNRDARSRLAGWLSYGNGTQVFLGYDKPSSQPLSPSCKQVTGSVSSDCTTMTAVGAAVLLRGGPAVLGGMDWQRQENGTLVDVPGQFLLRYANGTERVLGGDPGDTTLAMAADPTGATVWAITKEGDRYSIQRYRR